MNHNRTLRLKDPFSLSSRPADVWSFAYSVRFCDGADGHRNCAVVLTRGRFTFVMFTAPLVPLRCNAYLEYQ